MGAFGKGATFPDIFTWCLVSNGCILGILLMNSRDIHIPSTKSCILSPSNKNNRDYTIRQRRRSWKRCSKIDFASFHLFSRLFQGAQLLKKRELSLDLKRGDRDRVLTEMVVFIALPFPFSSKLKIWSFHVVVVQGLQRNVQKSVMHVQSCSFAH